MNYMGYTNKELYEWVERPEFINDKEWEVKEAKKEYAHFTKSWIDANCIDWQFKGIVWEAKEYEKNGKPNTMKICRIMLQDGEEEIILKLIMNNTARGILNTLVSQKVIWHLEIRIWMHKSWYSRIVMLNNGILMEWGMSAEEMKELCRKIIDPETQEVIKTIYDKLEDRLEELSKQVMPEDDDAFVAPEEDLPF